LITDDWESRKQSLLGTIDNDGAKSLLHHWSEIYEKESRIPQRKEIDPLSFMKAMPHIGLIEKDKTGGYLYRLAGDHLVEHIGKSLNGLYMEEVFEGELLTAIHVFYDKVTSEPAVALHQGHRHLPTCDYPVQYERLTFPLTDKKGHVKYLIGYTFFYGITDMAEAILGETNFFTHEEYCKV